MTTFEQREERLWTGPYARVVLGIFALMSSAAFESLAVATVMPAVADDLDGLGLYALAFAVPTAVGVVAMTVAGPLADGRGPGRALRVGVTVFSAGLVVAGLAPTMAVFLAGRAVQGFGIGLVTVGVYVVVGQVFPESMRSRVFTVLTSAWVLPALVGPYVAGSVADLVGWRWVFLGVPFVTMGSLLLLGAAIAGLDGSGTGRLDRGRLRSAGLAAAGVLLAGVAGQRAVPWWPVVLVLALAVTVVHGARLLPRGTWLGHRGLPTVIATRSLVSAAFFGAESYVPLSLVTHRGLSASEAGLLLTTAAVLWFTGSWLAANVPALDAKPLRVRLGTACVLVGVSAGFWALDDRVPVAVVAAVWSVGGLGMGLAASTLGVLLLDHADSQEQGAASAAMQTSDALVQSVVLAIGSVAFAAVLASHPTAGYVLVYAIASAVAVLGLLMALRVEDAP